MSRWSPTTPVQHGPTLGDVLASRVDALFERRARNKELTYQHERQAEKDKLAALLAEADLYDRGIRRGQAPDEGDRTIYAPEMQISGGDLAAALSKPIGLGGENPVKGGIFDRPVGLTPGFNPHVPHPLEMPNPTPLGAFDKATGDFNRGQPLGTLPSRYQSLGRDAYLDTTATPSARRSQEVASEREARHGDTLAEIDARKEATLAEILGRQQGVQGAQPVVRRDPVADHKAIRDYDIAHPLPSRAAQGGGAAGQGPLSRAQLPNATEQKSAGLYRMAKSAAATVDRLEPSIVASQIGRTPLVGNILMGATNPDAQALQQASYQLADAWMRFVSGAAVPEPEVKRYMSMITPQPGDKPEVTRQKQETRRQIIAALEKAGGRAMDDATRQLHTGSDVNPPPASAGSSGDIDLRQPVPTKAPSGSSLSDADMWEQLVAAGVDKAEATRRVQARHKAKP